MLRRVAGRFECCLRNQVLGPKVSGKVFYGANVAHFFKIQRGILALITTSQGFLKKINTFINGVQCHIFEFNRLIYRCLCFAFLLLVILCLDVSWQTKSALRSVKK